MTRKALNSHLRDTGLFFPIDPGADASIGGMAATRASGTNAVRYGTMRENVLGLTVVTADGSIVRTGTRARKSSAGYDLTRLFVGSEGTLGIITEIQLRLYGIPEAMSAAVCSFADLAGAVDTVIATIQSGIPVARIELLDELQMQAVNAYSKLDYPVQPTLFFEFHGTTAGVEEQAAMVADLAESFGGGAFQWASQRRGPQPPVGRPPRRLLGAEGAAARLRDQGHRHLRPDLAPRRGDPRRPCGRRREAGLIAPIVGHAGDGNFHMTFLLDPSDPGEFERAEAVNARMVERAIAMGGTCTGEHGVGIGKIDHVEQEHGAGVDLMRRIKRALDPGNLLNPGKIFRLDPSDPRP